VGRNLRAGPALSDDDFAEPNDGVSPAQPNDGVISAGPLEGVRFRRPTEADYATIVAVIDDWWGGRQLDHLLPRLWLQHFTGTSWLAETGDGKLAGFVVGFLSPDHPRAAYCHLIAASPNRRRRGLGRQLYERFFADARAGGRTTVTAITWPANRASIAFHRALGFEVLDGPGRQNLYGTPAVAGYDFDREDRAVLVRSI
jgi:ribosomal protein S18 acetylase RimI-like enzyme